MDTGVLDQAYQTVLIDQQSVPVGTYLQGPFWMESFRNILLTGNKVSGSGTVDVNILRDDYATGTQVALKDGANAAVAMDNWAGGETGVRTLGVGADQLMPGADTDNVYAPAASADKFYKQVMPANFYVQVIVGTASVVFALGMDFMP